MFSSLPTGHQACLEDGVPARLRGDLSLLCWTSTATELFLPVGQASHMLLLCYFGGSTALHLQAEATLVFSTHYAELARADHSLTVQLTILGSRSSQLLLSSRRLEKRLEEMEQRYTSDSVLQREQLGVLEEKLDRLGRSGDTFTPGRGGEGGWQDPYWFDNPESPVTRLVLLLRWVRTMVEPAPRDERIPVQTLFLKYQEDCRERGKVEEMARFTDAPTFGKKLHQILAALGIPHSNVKDNRDVRSVVGIRARRWGKESFGEETQITCVETSLVTSATHSPREDANLQQQTLQP